MKLIEASDGAYVNTDQVKFYYADKHGRVFAVFDRNVDDEGETIHYFSRQIGRFADKSAAQDWLDDFAADINKEN